MKAGNEKVVSLIYKLEVDGEIKDQTTIEKPLQFIFGLGYLLPEFEANVEGKEPEDEFDFVLSAAEGYGEFDPTAIVELPKSIFVVDGELREDILFVGSVIPMMNQAGGIMQGKVLEVSDESVKMDFNHDLAGKELHFTGKIVDVRDATEKELTDGLFGERAAHECGGDCSSCGGGCH